MTPHRCVDCHRVRFSMLGDWENHPGLMDGEVAVLCGTCAGDRGLEQLKQRLENVRRTRRRLAGREPWAPGTTPDDPFAGMREPKP